MAVQMGSRYKKGHYTVWFLYIQNQAFNCTYKQATKNFFG